MRDFGIFRPIWKLIIINLFQFEFIRKIFALGKHVCFIHAPFHEFLFYHCPSVCLRFHGHSSTIYPNALWNIMTNVQLIRLLVNPNNVFFSLAICFSIYTTTNCKYFCLTVHKTHSLSRIHNLEIFIKLNFDPFQCAFDILHWKQF